MGFSELLRVLELRHEAVALRTRRRRCCRGGFWLA